MIELKENFLPSKVPPHPGVYVYRDRFGSVIYVGKASNLRRRLGNYFQPPRRRTGDAKLRSLINSIWEWSYQVVKSEDEALILESSLIKTYAPHYNILMRDDKRYLLLKLDMSEKFPTLRCARFKAGDNARYFGPFSHGTALKGNYEMTLVHQWDPQQTQIILALKDLLPRVSGEAVESFFVCREYDVNIISSWTKSITHQLGQDGNGRVGRLILFKECLKNGIVPFIIDEHLKLYYYRGLSEWKNEKGFLRDTCLTGQDKFKAWLDYFKINY